MKIVHGNIWDYPAHFLCITTNGTVKKNGELVMGRGIAFQAVQYRPSLAKIIGNTVSTWGNHVYLHCTKEDGFFFISFPVKHNWWERADIELIERSIQELCILAKRHSSSVFVLPRPGCGNGGLDWEEVRPIIENLPNNVHVISLGTKEGERDVKQTQV